MIQNTLALKSPEFLYDDTFIEYFFSLKKAHSFVEYYYVEDPTGFVLVSDTGDLSRLLVYSEADLQRLLFSLKRHHPPAFFQQQVSSGRAVPWLWENPEDLGPEDAFDWTEHLHEAERIGQGNSIWFCALVDNPPADIEYDSGSSSYSAYLEMLDTSDG